MPAILPRRKLGRTGLDVTVMGFGSAPLGDIYEVLDDKTATAAVETAAQSGVMLFDTAPLYGQGSSEHRWPRSGDSRYLWAGLSMDGRIR